MELTELIQEKDPGLGRKIEAACKLSIPTMISQFSSLAMQYIDAAMVGSLGAAASASIGIVSASMWLVEGLVFAAVYGFSVQIAYELGATRKDEAKRIFRQGIFVNAVWGLLLLLAGVLISAHLPVWLGAEKDVIPGSASYFRIYCFSLPFVCLHRLSAASLQAAGKMRITAVFESLMCLFDVFYNMLLIFPSGIKRILGLKLYIPGAGLGVSGAALGTALAEVTVMIALTIISLRFTEELRFDRSIKAPLTKRVLRKAFQIGGPYALERTVISGAQITVTKIIAPLGTVSVASNSFAVTAEGICYMPGYGMAAAASPLVGQSLGAGKKKLARSFAWITVILGMIIMGAFASVMYFACPYVFAFFTPVQAVRELGIRALRTVLPIEPLFGASIVTTGALRGAGDTLVPSILSLVSIWGVRITLCLILVGRIGLLGAWVAMAAELTFRGTIFLLRLRFGHWENKMD